MFLEEDTKLAFNKFLKENLKKYNFTSNKNEISYTIFSDISMKSARGMLPPDNIDSPGWFNFSRDILQLLIDKRTEILNRIRQIDLDPKLAKHLASSARRNVNDGIVLAKSRWTHFLAETIHKLSDLPKEAWKSVNTLKYWIHDHYKTPDIMRFQLPNSNFSSTNEEHVEILCKHFISVYSGTVSIDWRILDELSRK